MRELFFEAAARRFQIGRVHQRHRVRLHPATTQHPPEQMLVDASQTLHAEVLAELMEHPRRGTVAAQSRKPPPRRLLGQLRDDQVQRMGGSQQSQQVCAPELRCAQSVTAAARAFTGVKLGDEVIRHVRVQTFKQRARADYRECCNHAWTLTEDHL